MEKTEYIPKDEFTILKKVCEKVFDNLFKIGVASHFWNIEGLEETDYSTLTVQEIMQKIKDFLTSDPSDASYVIFLNYLARFPVSMCKREVSDKLKLFIGFNYRFGIPTPEQMENGAGQISMDDLAEWFGRSKATVSDYIEKTESAWKGFQRLVEEERLREQAHNIALKELVEEEKEKLKQQQNNQKNKQIHEQTS